MNKLPESLDFTDKAITEVEVQKNKALSAMEHHLDEEKQRIYEQALLLKKQMNEINERETLSYIIHEAEYQFEPVMLKKYSLYKRSNNSYVLSLIEPNEWNGTCPLGIFVHFVHRLGDGTWDIIKEEKGE